MNPFLRRGKLRLREIKSPAQGVNCWKVAKPRISPTAKPNLQITVLPLLLQTLQRTIGKNWMSSSPSPFSPHTYSLRPNPELSDRNPGLPPTLCLWSRSAFLALFSLERVAYFTGTMRLLRRSWKGLEPPGRHGQQKPKTGHPSPTSS